MNKIRSINFIIFTVFFLTLLVSGVGAQNNQSFTMYGTVSVPSGNGELIPIENALISLHAGGTALSTESDEDGYYALEVPYMSNVQVYEATCTSAGYSAQAVTFFVDPSMGSEIEINFILTPNDNTLTGIFGQILGQTDWGIELPIEGAFIEATLMNTPTDPAYSTYSDYNGHYELPLEAGLYQVSCSKDGYESVELEVVIEGEPVNINFMLSSTGGGMWSLLSGTVYNNDWGDDLPPIHGAQIIAIPLESPNSETFFAESNEEGFYEMEIPVGAYEVTCSAEGFNSVTAVVFIGDFVETVQDFYLTSSSTSEFGSLAGYVYGMNDDGVETPLAGAQVLGHGPLNDFWTVETDEEGFYEVHNLMATGYFVQVSVEGYQPAQADVEIISGEIVELNFILEPGNMEGSGILTGEVTAQLSPDGPQFPVEGASIGATPAWGPEPWFETYTDSTGHYELELPAWGMPWIVYCTTEYGQQEATVIIENDAVVELSFHFNAWEQQEYPPPQELTTEYNNDELVFVLHWEPPASENTSIQPSHYRIFGSFLEWGDWFFLGETEETAFVHQFVDIPEQGLVCFAVTAVYEDGGESEFSNEACAEIGGGGENGIITGYVWYIEYDMVIPVAGAHIVVTNNWQTYETNSNDDGSYGFEVVAGYYIVTCILPDGGEVQSAEVQVGFGQTVEVNFTFGDASGYIALSGHVYGEWGPELEPIYGAHVIAFSPDGESFFTESGDDGYYWLNLPHSGEYFVSVTANGFFPIEATVIIEGVTEMNFTLTPYEVPPGVTLSLGSGSGTAGSSVELPIFLSSSVEIGGIQATIADYPNLVTAVDFYSGSNCFQTEFNEIEGQVLTLLFSPDGCVFYPGEFQYATLVYEISGEAEYGTDIALEFSELFVSDPFGGPISSTWNGGSIEIEHSGGDINGDGFVDIFDIILLVDFVLQFSEPTDAQFDAGDLNMDDELNIYDIVLLVNMILDYSRENGLAKSSNTAEVVLGSSSITISGNDIGGFEITSSGNFTIDFSSVPQDWTVKSSSGKILGFNFERNGDTQLSLRFDGSMQIEGIMVSDGMGRSVETGLINLPEQILLEQNYPNPFNPMTTIRFEIPGLQTMNETSLQIFDITGRLFATLVDGEMKPGFHNINWDASEAASGIYIYRLTTEYGHISRKMVLLK